MSNENHETQMDRVRERLEIFLGDTLQSMEATDSRDDADELAAKAAAYADALSIVESAQDGSLEPMTDSDLDAETLELLRERAREHREQEWVS